jgi:hypothetical protein
LNVLVEEINQLVAHGIVYADEQFDILISILTTQGIICRLALSVVVLKDQSGWGKICGAGSTVKLLLDDGVLI